MSVQDDVSIGPKLQSRQLLPLLLLHLAAAGVCFAFFTVVPTVACLILVAIGNDPGGPLFLPIFIMGVVLCAAIITTVLAAAVLMTDLLRRYYRVALWLPPLVIFVLATGFAFLLLGGAHAVAAVVAGGVVTTAFIVHWAAISTVWFLPRLLFRLFKIEAVPPKITG